MKRLKFGQEKFGHEKFGKEKPLGKENLWKFAGERRSKLGKLKLGNARLKFGKALAVAAPTMAKAAKDTMIAGTWPEGACCGTSGGLLSCVALSGVSATCVPTCQPSPKLFPHHRSINKKSRRVDDPATTGARLPT